MRRTRGTRKKHSVHLIRLICRMTLGWSPARSGRATLLGVFLEVLPCIPSATQGRKGLRARVLPLAHRPDRAPPAKRPFERGEVVEAEVHPPPLQRRRPQAAQQEQRRIVLRPAAKGAAPAAKSAPLRVPRQPVLPERSRPQRVVPEAVDGELEGEARQARTRTRSPKAKGQHHIVAAARAQEGAPGR